MATRDLQFLFTAFVPQCTHVIDKFFEGYSTLQFMEAGRVQLQVGQKLQVMEGPWAWSCYPGPRIRFRCAIPGKTWVHRYLAFRGPLVTRWQKSSLFPIDPQSIADPGPIATKVDEIISLSRHADRWGHHRAILTLELLLVELAESRSKTPVNAPSALHESRLIPESGEVNLELLASEAGMSSRTFRRQFKQRMGLSPRAYILGQRINRAKQLLTDTTLPIKQIATQLGYSDVYFFTRQFREQTGLPPALYRRSREH
jgi:AraC-like DNA-binding protein